MFSCFTAEQLPNKHVCTFCEWIYWSKEIRPARICIQGHIFRAYAHSIYMPAHCAWQDVICTSHFLPMSRLWTAFDKAANATKPPIEWPTIVIPIERDVYLDCNHFRQCTTKVVWWTWLTISILFVSSENCHLQTLSMDTGCQQEKAPKLVIQWCRWPSNHSEYWWQT